MRTQGFISSIGDLYGGLCRLSLQHVIWYIPWFIYNFYLPEPVQCYENQYYAEKISERLSWFILVCTHSSALALYRHGI